MAASDVGAAALRLRVARPAVPPELVVRARIDTTLSRGVMGPVTVVCAGAGYGKTLAVAAWAERTSTPVAWLTADGGADVPSFWTDLITALRTVDEDGMLAPISPGPDFGASDIAEVGAMVDGRTAPAVVVIDDFHRVTDPGVLESLSHLLTGAPRNLRLILIGRTWPRLRLRRMQLDGAVTEITAEELAFTGAETRELCAGVDIAEADLELLTQRTQGWPAGLRLVLLNHADRGRLSVGDRLRHFTGQNRMVAAYLLEEVLAGLSPSDRRFMLATSIVPEISADLAYDLTGREDSRRVLETMVADNALTVRLADRPDWFRFHPLLRELLRDRLLTEAPDSVPELHRRAASWLVDAGDHVGAIRHLLAAGDWAQAVQVLGAYAIPLMLTARATELISVLRRFESEVRSRPTVEAKVIGMVLAYHRRDFLAMEQCAVATETLAAESAVALTTPVRVVVAMGRMVTARVHDIDDLIMRCNDFHTLVSGSTPTELPMAPAYVTIAANNLGIGEVLDGRLVEARATLEEAVARAADFGMELVALAGSGYLSLLDLIDGRLSDAGRQSEQALAAAARRGWSSQPQLAISHAVAVGAALHAGDLEVATMRVQRARAGIELSTDLAATMILETYAIWVAVAGGDDVAARMGAERLAVLRVRAGRLPSLLDRWMRITLVRARLMAGDLDGARAGLPVVPSGWRLADLLERIVLAEVAVASGDAGEVPTVLGPSMKYADYPVQQCEALVVAAVGATRQRRDAQALDYVSEAIGVAAATGAVRPFAAWATDIRPIVLRYKLLTEHPAEVVDKIIEMCGGSAESGGVAEEFDVVAADQVLTERELAVLRYLPTMYKASEIAADLFVSVNTVKTHQQSIYRKLGVSTRRDAVDRARQRKLL